MSLAIHEEWWFKVVVYFGFVILYLSKYKNGSDRSVECVVKKCLPLISAIALHLCDTDFKFSIPPTTYSQKILSGLIFGMIGDGALAMSETDNDFYFLVGYVNFCIGHLMYINAFGLHPLDPESLGIFLVFFILGMHKLFQVYSGISDRNMVVLYGILVTTMGWRACAKSGFFINKQVDHAQLTLMTGGILFVLSDFLLATKGCCPIQDCQIWILATYYCGQFAIWTSTMNWKTFRVLP